jgi:hypothetical protein
VIVSQNIEIRIMHEEEEDVEDKSGISQRYFKVKYRHLLGGTEENKKPTIRKYHYEISNVCIGQS